MHIVISIDDLTDSSWPTIYLVPSPEPAQNTVERMARMAFQRLLKDMPVPIKPTRPTGHIYRFSLFHETADVVDIQKPPHHQGSWDHAPSSDPAGVDPD